MTATDAEFSVFCPGILDVLSIGKGDLRLSVGDSDDDRERARNLIEEMLRKGYSIFVETDQGQKQVKKFNAKRMTYIVVGEPSEGAADAVPTKRKGRQSEVPVSGSKATAVGRTAGG